MKTCPFHKQLSLYIDDELNQDERFVLEKHLSDCAGCRTELDKFKQASMILSKWQVPSEPDDFSEKVKAGILEHEEKMEEPEMKLTLNWKSFAVPATVMVGIVACLFTLQTYVTRGGQGRLKTARLDVMGEMDNRFGGRNQPASFERDEMSAGRGYELKKDYAQSSQVIGGLSDGESFYRDDKSFDIVTGPKEKEEFARRIANEEGRYNQAQLAARPESETLKSPMSVPSEPVPASGIIVVQPVLPAAGEGEKVIRTAVVRLEVQNSDETYSKISELSTQLGGFLAQSNFYKDTNGVRSGEIILRIPKDNFEEALEKLRAFGKVEGMNTQSQNVGREYADLESRLKTAMIVYDKMMKAIEKRNVTIPDAMQLESELTPVTERIERIKAEIEKLNNLTAFTTITVQFHESKVSAAGIKESVKQARENIVIHLLGALNLLVESLPVIFAVAAVIAVGLIVIAFIKRKFTSFVKKPKE